MLDEPARILVALAHVGGAAIWLGAMLYSLGVVQPRAERLLEAEGRYEELATTLAAGARWKVLGLCAVLALSGVGLVLVEPSGAGKSMLAWSVLIALKVALLGVAVALFAHVSWRAWPARLFAVGAELPAHRRRFRRLALVLTALVGAAFALGVAAGQL